MLRSLTLLVVGFAATALFAAPATPKAGEEKSHTGTVVSAAAGKLTMTDAAGKEHSHMVPATAKIMLEGKAGKLEDLKKGDKITVTMDAAKTVTAITRGSATPAKPAAKTAAVSAPKPVAVSAAKPVAKPAK